MIHVCDCKNCTNKTVSRSNLYNISLEVALRLFHDGDIKQFFGFLTLDQIMENYRQLQMCDLCYKEYKNKIKNITLFVSRDRTLVTFEKDDYLIKKEIDVFNTW